MSAYINTLTRKYVNFISEIMEKNYMNNMKTFYNALGFLRDLSVG